MMPLNFADVGADNIIRKIGGNDEIKKHLETLGFVVGGSVRIVADIGGNIIVDVKGSRVAVSREMAQKILI